VFLCIPGHVRLQLGLEALERTVAALDAEGNRTVTDARKPSWIVRIPTPLWLIGLIVVALLIDWTLQLPAIAQHRPGGIALIIAGFAFSAWARQTFSRHRAEIFPWSDTHEALVTSGPFRLSRNPMYLGILVIGVGAALVAGTWPMWLVPVLVFVLDNFVIIPFEERSMERTFGDAYRAYRSRVRRWL
jgi:protein-S-isoprenylcysteine O-methyltransferase Ste14